jgi:NADH-quinone oxidoreductase subunit G
MAGNAVDLCPVGALGDRDFLYKQRVWFMKRRPHVCAGCATGCSIFVEENQDRIYRLKPRENPYLNQWWMCDEGRYGWKHVHDTNRFTAPRKSKDGHVENVEWSTLTTELDTMLRQCRRLAAVISPHLTVEEAYLLASYVRQIDPEAALVQGPIPVRGTDESFPGGFAIRAEKCPNRRGVELVLSSVAGKIVTWDEFLGQLNSSHWDAIWISGGYSGEWLDASIADRFAAAGRLIVQDLFASPLLERAEYQLPAAAFPEREGSFVNLADRLQSFRWAIRPPGGVMVEAQLLWRLTGHTGLFKATSVLEQIAHDHVAFSAARGGVPEVGVDLKANQLAEV